VLCTGDPFAVQLSRLLASLVKARRFGMTNFRVARHGDFDCHPDGARCLRVGRTLLSAAFDFHLWL
jgi:hypothetical protein